MSILKVILHRWNKTTKSHDTIHPETEVSQVTDWNQGIVNTLASTALGTLVNTLTSDSLLATMIQKVLTATGVKYSMGQNGYICFGSLFGGLIIQWGKDYLSSSGQEFIAPLATTHMWGIFVMDVDHGCDRFGAETTAGNKFMVWNKSDSGNFTETNFRWFAICG